MTVQRLGPVTLAVEREPTGRHARLLVEVSAGGMAFASRCSVPITACTPDGDIVAMRWWWVRNVLEQVERRIRR